MSAAATPANPFLEIEAMYQTSIAYHNGDGQFRFGQLIRSTMEKHGGKEIGCGQDLETSTRDIAFAFEEEGKRYAAWEELQEALGDCWREVEVSSPMEPEEPESTELVVEYDPNQPWIPREIVSLFTFDLCFGWRDWSRGNPYHTILTECRSLDAARYLKWKIDTAPFAQWVNAYFVADEEDEPVPSLN
jgi:hypothetical protein